VATGTSFCPTYLLRLSDLPPIAGISLRPRQTGLGVGGQRNAEAHTAEVVAMRISSVKTPLARRNGPLLF
jgi:hypothetical protein